MEVTEKIGDIRRFQCRKHFLVICITGSEAPKCIGITEEAGELRLSVLLIPIILDGITDERERMKRAITNLSRARPRRSLSSPQITGAGYFRGSASLRKPGL